VEGGTGVCGGRMGRGWFWRGRRGAAARGGIAGGRRGGRGLGVGDAGGGDALGHCRDGRGRENGE